MNTTEKKMIGDTVMVSFATAGNKQIPGKVDTGATTSSLHATDITISGQQCSFMCPLLSSNRVSMNLVGQQQVHSADGGGQNRPIVSFDIEIDGTPIRGAEFNLNDRGNMDDKILIGQNIITAGNFIVDINMQDNVTESIQDEPSYDSDSIRHALSVLIASNLTIQQLIDIASSTK